MQPCLASLYITKLLQLGQAELDKLEDKLFRNFRHSLKRPIYEILISQFQVRI
jgi:hypothetical protein